MKNKYYRLAALFVGVLSVISAVLIVLNFDPNNTTNSVKLLFFASLFFAILGISVFGFSFLGKPEFTRVYRRGFLLTLYLITLILVGRVADISVIGIVIISAIFIAIELIWFYLFETHKT